MTYFEIIEIFGGRFGGMGVMDRNPNVHSNGLNYMLYSGFNTSLATVTVEESVFLQPSNTTITNPFLGV